MRGYAGFTQGCASAPTASPVGITTDPSGIIGVAAAATASQPTRSSGGFNLFDTDGGSATGAVKTRIAEHQGADGIATVIADDSSASSLGLTSGLGGMTWIVTGLAGGLLLVYAG
ncbi:hypothetical protein I302_100701 [Kwoniella bestiolae CBS 10118]|uniref:Uncharacterized protein n=1 Tax=Kwoniella bestiolae CBS 10118 TaxID=1296100 RepID=A0A1B9G5V3_9TREE|nr:hypothetical protein I302_04076 [Kwoniella bestiolae CBS 10118]OCF26393.1 hypothetical protein I302_04076 [Kwoniella bestiolae CBS 10118]